MAARTVEIESLNMPLKDHAQVDLDGFKVPLIGIPPDAVIQECDLCHNEFQLREIEMTDAGQCLCATCRLAGKLGL